MRMFSVSILLLTLLVSISQCSDYIVDVSGGLGRQFDGIGGLSGGGATSKLLVNYPEPYRSEILDYLFKPNFAASLQILKVEIGGDSQSTDGTESSHMHEPWDEAYNRGYEWWLMVEAKKRNPDIKLCALPWAFPGWLGKSNPYTDVNKTAHYVLKWIQGAKKYYNLDIDYLGIWNERPYNTGYVKILRKVLDQNGFHNTRLVVADGNWEVVKDIASDKVFADAVDYIGAHYPGTNSTVAAQKTNKKLWASEDYSTFNDGVGAGCWARILNQNYVNGYMTGTIAWNLIASYYQALPFGRDGLMTAQEPWSGHYVVQSPIWVTAHTTQFSAPGWFYLKHGSGVGMLQSGGSYVTLTDAKSQELSIVIETMSHNHSLCIRPALPSYNVKAQNATFVLGGKFASISKLFVWYSRLRFDGQPDNMFSATHPIMVRGGRFTLSLGVDELLTLTTVERQPPRPYPKPPPSQDFILPYMDDFETYQINNEAYNFAPQVGVWEVRPAAKIKVQDQDKGQGQVNRQVMLHEPCYWCKTPPYPLNIGGNYNWSDIYIQVDVMIPSVNSSKGAFVATRVSKGGCSQPGSQGIFFSIKPGSKTAVIASDIGFGNILKSAELNSTVLFDRWYTLALLTRAGQAYGYVNAELILMSDVPNTPKRGFVGYGARSFGIVDYDNLVVTKRG